MSGKLEHLFSILEQKSVFHILRFVFGEHVIVGKNDHTVKLKSVILITYKDAIETLPLLLRFEATLCIRTMSLIVANYDQIVQFRVDNKYGKVQDLTRIPRFCHFDL